MTVERLRRIKREREAWVRKVTGISPQNGTVVIRLIGRVRGYEVELTKPTVAEAVIRSEERFPDFPLSLHGDGFEIDLRHVHGEAVADATYWNQCKQQIDGVLKHRLTDALREDVVQHVSVFGFARLPLLVYFGSRLDDTFAVAIYQRHRSTEAWHWPDDDSSPVNFIVDTIPDRSRDVTEGVLILNVSGSIQAGELPAHLTTLPRWVVRPENSVPSVDTINSQATLSEYTRTLRLLLSEIESSYKNVRKLHVLAAVPVSAAVALGRIHDAHVHPAMIIYDRTDGLYSVALEIS